MPLPTTKNKHVMFNQSRLRAKLSLNKLYGKQKHFEDLAWHNLGTTEVNHTGDLHEHTNCNLVAPV